MNVVSGSFQINAEDVATAIINQPYVIPNDGWTPQQLGYDYALQLPIEGVKVSDYVMIDIMPNYEDVAIAADISNYCLEYDGGVTLYANNIPTSSITISYTIIRG